MPKSKNTRTTVIHTKQHNNSTNDVKSESKNVKTTQKQNERHEKDKTSKTTLYQ
jgi:hypothetical protein